MQYFTTYSKSAHRVEKFLDLLDHFTEAKGLNVPQIVEIDKLKSLPQGTFGRTWADFLNQNNLQPFITGTRRKQLHDGVHVLAGYATDPIGEAELQAFLLGAKFTITNLMLGLGLLRMIYKNLNYQQQFAWERLQKAYQRGCDSNFDPDIWQPELLWHLPLTDVQKMFGVI
ncbi:Coq4 family protein [Anabaena sp. UHCC 0451]|uniref:Coq4 family protein n=1 Tax=Anabaena sp. UHCC 0451 TaxID=2055235 RepID=UPI002B2197E2|nr:Coq4 family protein [Anabaena sp. UHCC 0451]MEA5574860.1 Coq4 family protein [Anabaena sp. UHCC 0451]